MFIKSKKSQLTIYETWNRSLIIQIREENELFVYKLWVRDLLCIFTIQEVLTQTYKSANINGEF